MRGADESGMGDCSHIRVGTGRAASSQLTIVPAPVRVREETRKTSRNGSVTITERAWLHRHARFARARCGAGVHRSGGRRQQAVACDYHSLNHSAKWGSMMIASPGPL